MSIFVSCFKALAGSKELVLETSFSGEFLILSASKSPFVFFLLDFVEICISPPSSSYILTHYDSTMIFCSQLHSDLIYYCALSTVGI